MYILRNKKINVNMITMGMAVMVESDDNLWFIQSPFNNPNILINELYQISIMFHLKVQ
jgi:hypothetical protein